MSHECVHPLDTETLELFAAKGMQAECAVPQVGNANGVKVRRVMQITRDFAKVPFEQLRILDLACGEGVYAIEAALRGAEVVALDARTERMNEGAKAAERLGLNHLRFEQVDIRKVNSAPHGQFDVIFFLGILYHLDASDVFPVLQNVYEMCRNFVVIDTHIALHHRDRVQHNDRSYDGIQVREHRDEDPESVRKSKLLASLDNAFSFWFTRESLYRLLHDCGFTSVCECHVPFEPFKPENRITVIASKGSPVKISSYPWVNDKTEDEIQAYLQIPDQHQEGRKSAKRPGIRHFVKTAINGTLRPLGLEIRGIEKRTKQ